MKSLDIVNDLLREIRQKSDLVDLDQDKELLELNRQYDQLELIKEDLEVKIS